MIYIRRYLPIEPADKIPSTRIICTINHKKVSTDDLNAFIQSGMSVARFNFSHVEPQDYDAVFSCMRCIKALAARLHPPRAVGILMDLAGSEIRISSVDGKPRFCRGSVVDIKTPVQGIEAWDLPRSTRRQIWVDKPSFFEAVREQGRPGTMVLIGDQDVKLEITRFDDAGRIVVCEAKADGSLRSRQSVSVRECRFPFDASKDERDLREMGRRCLDIEPNAEWPINYVACSLIKTPADVNVVQGEVRLAFARDLPIVAKLETAESVQEDNLRGILEALAPTSDNPGAVMVARGDLALSIPPEEVPLKKRLILKEAATFRVPSIVATQMLQSMVEKPQPTRAEADDVWSAVELYADCVMLSDETASPSALHPREAVEVLARIARHAENSRESRSAEPIDPSRGRLRAVARAARDLAEGLDSPAIVLTTDRGKTAAEMAYHKSRRPILALTANPTTEAYLLLHGGVFPMLHDLRDERDMGPWLSLFEEALIDQGLCVGNEDHDRRFVVTLFGLKAWASLTAPSRVLETNTIRLIDMPRCARPLDAPCCELDA